MKPYFSLSLPILGRIIAIFIILSMVISACGVSSSNTPVGNSQNTGANDASSESPTTEEQGSGTLRIAMQPIVQTDPALISSDSEVLILSHVYEYLIDVDPESKIIPRLAKEWAISQDGLIYTFKLEDDVHFHDGSLMTARDVVWTFDRLRDPASGYPTADLFANIDQIEALNDSEVKFTLKEPNPFFLYDLSDNHALILKEKTTHLTDFNGTGPFKVLNYSPEDRMELVANDRYWLEGQPKLSAIEAVFFNDDTAMVDALRSGQIDLVMRLATPLYDSLKSEPTLTTLSVPSNKFDVVRLRSDHAPGNDPRVIQAFKLATDRQALFQLVQQENGAVGRDSPIGPMYLAYYSESTALPKRDVEAARKLLSEAGFPDGIKLDLHTPDTENRPDLAAALKNQWADAGIDVNVIVEPESVYYGDNGWLEVDLGITGWGSRPYPQFYLDVMLVCDAKWNESHFCDEELDRLAKKAGTTLNEEERTIAYQTIQRILIERGPIIVPYFSATNAAISNHFSNFQLKAFPGRSDLRAVSRP